MLRFNIQQAKKDGLSDEEITRLISQGPSQQTATRQQPQANKENLLASLLPLIGSLLGGGVGALGGPLGVVAGSAAGSGLGEYGRQKFSGEETSGGKILGESAIGGVGGVFSNLLRGGKAATAVAKTAKGAKAVGGTQKAANYLTSAGKDMKRSIAEPLGTKAVGSGPLQTEVADDVANYLEQTKGRSAIAKANNIAKEYKTQNAKIKKILGTSEGDIPVNGKELFKTIKTNANAEYDMTSGIGKTNLKILKPEINSISNTRDLGELNKKLLAMRKNTGGEKKKAIGAIQSVVGEQLKTAVPKIAEPYARMSATYKPSEVLTETIKRKYHYAGFEVPKTRVQELKDIVGGGLMKTGNLISKYKTPISLAGGQIGARGAGAFTGGGQSGYEPTPQISSESAYDLANVPEETGGFNITREQVALARLTLPDKQADAIEAAYNVLSKSNKDTDLTEAQVARKSAVSLTGQALQMLTANPNLKTGMVGGPLEQVKAKFGAGDPDSLAFNALISNLTATIAKARAGTSFTPNEEKMLKQYSPVIGDSRQQLLVKLTVLQSTFGK